MHYGDVYCKMHPADPGKRKLRPTVNSTIQVLRHKCEEHFDQLSKRGGENWRTETAQNTQESGGE
jgi:hypothetical protein